MKDKIRTAIAVSAAAVIAACVFTGCSGDKNKDIEYAPVDEAVKSADSVLGNTYQNFTLPENINITVPDKLYTIKADHVDGCDRNEMIDKLTDVVLPGYKGTGTLTEEDNGQVAKCVYDNDIHATIWYYEGGTFVYARSELTVPETMMKNGKQYIVGKDDLSDTYILNGEQYSVKEAVDYAEKYARENLMPFLFNDTEIKAESACAFRIDETDNYWIFVELEHYIEGCPLSTVGEPWLDHPFMRPSQLLFTFDGKDKICHIENICYSHFAEKKEVDEILTLEAALKHLEKELAPNSAYTFKDVKLAYCARVEDVFKYEYEYRPTWCFTTRYGYESSNTDINPREVIYVDALNGDVYCYSDIELKMKF